MNSSQQWFYRCCLAFALVLQHQQLAFADTNDDAAKAGYDAAQNAVSIPVKHEAQVFKSDQHSFEFTPPEKFSLKELSPTSGKMFMFTGPSRSDEKHPVMSVSLIETPAGEALPTLQAVLDGMLKPFRDHLIDYKEETKPPIIVNGHTYTGSYFSGSYSGEFPARGLVLATDIKDGYFVFFAQDLQPYFDKSSLPIFMQSLNSCKILK